MKALPTDRDGKWRSGMVIRKVAPRSYNVEVDGSTYRRNRKFLRLTKEVITQEIEHNTDTDIIQPLESSTRNNHCDLTSKPNKIPSSAVKLPMTEDLPTHTTPICTRTRTVSMPSRFKDFVLN